MKRIVKLTERDLTRLVNKVIKEQLVNKVIKEQGDMNNDIKTIIDTILKCAEGVEQEGYDDFYDWSNVVFSCAEWKLEEMFDEDIIDNLRLNYDGVIMGLWEDKDDDLLESELARIVRRVIKEQGEEMSKPKHRLGHKDRWYDEDDRISDDFEDYDEEFEFGPDDFKKFQSMTSKFNNKWNPSYRKPYYDKYTEVSPLRLRRKN